jgi:CRISPR-associated protein Csd1
LSWFRNLAQTYDRLSNIIGIPDANGNILPPLNHMMKANTNICVTIDGEGKFRRADKESKTIVIPCTEESETERTSGITPHSLHEELGYLACNIDKNTKYLAQLAPWCNRHPKVEAVYKYVVGGTLIDDLRNSGIVVDIDKVNKLKKNGTQKTEKEIRDEVEKQFIRFSVEIEGDSVSHLWEDTSVVEAWQMYCAEPDPNAETLCYVTGRFEKTRLHHPRSIVPGASNAKLISSEDKTNYSFRGRFMEAKETNAISVGASHKAHAALRYLIVTQGYRCDTQAIVAWAIDDGRALPNPFEDSLGIYADAIQTDSDEIIKAQGEIATDYALKLRSALSGYGDVTKLSSTVRHVAIITVDSAVPGRGAVTFYQDMTENEYIDRIVEWHESCHWYFRKKEEEYLSSPSADKIFEVVYGILEGEGGVKIKKQVRERMLHMIVCKERMSRAWVNAAVQHVSNPLSYREKDKRKNKKDGKWDEEKWQDAISVACAISKKFYSECKEGFFMELESECTDRDYLYGRLLAIADRAESHAHYLQMKRSGTKDGTEKRPTNAVRYMPAFAAKPFRTWNVIYSQLNPYIQQLKSAEWYQKKIDDVMSLFKDGDYEDDKPLSGKYLMGYSLQRREFYDTSNNEEVSNELDEED